MRRREEGMKWKMVLEKGAVESTRSEDKGDGNSDESVVGLLCVL